MPKQRRASTTTKSFANFLTSCSCKSGLFLTKSLQHPSSSLSRCLLAALSGMVNLASGQDLGTLATYRRGLPQPVDRPSACRLKVWWVVARTHLIVLQIVNSPYRCPTRWWRTVCIVGHYFRVAPGFFCCQRVYSVVGKEISCNAVVQLHPTLACSKGHKLWQHTGFDTGQHVSHQGDERHSLRGGATYMPCLLWVRIRSLQPRTSNCVQQMLSLCLRQITFHICRNY